VHPHAGFSNEIGVKFLHLDVVGVGDTLAGGYGDHLDWQAFGGYQFEAELKIVGLHPAPVRGAPGVFLGGGDDLVRSVAQLDGHLPDRPVLIADEFDDRPVSSFASHVVTRQNTIARFEVFYVAEPAFGPDFGACFKALADAGK
jgi:hypothetical protein